jgi:hypothetical protein
MEDIWISVLLPDGRKLIHRKDAKEETKRREGLQPDPIIQQSASNRMTLEAPLRLSVFSFASSR